MGSRENLEMDKGPGRWGNAEPMVWRLGVVTMGNLYILCIDYIPILLFAMQLAKQVSNEEWCRKLVSLRSTLQVRG